ncbi:HAD-IB family hydrolase [Cupriavidus basilensis]|uniref:HAD-IB family hydrolase n=1 Tax=Cupriavidus basilensis TaxID=68895 RepID=A0ABT6AYZ0_9BURK|nr:HAD family hydrolase [Cupriavidus basilensis]MDF3837817.1 HAD-IB family hydrolase [Cupriavidus basilensis]
MSCLALFDLDHTLLPLDSEYEWARYLVEAGAADAREVEANNALWLAEYGAGRLDFHRHAAFALGLLARHPRARLEALRSDFMRNVIAPAILPEARALLARHRDAGDLCCIVTATCRFVTEPIAAALEVDHLVAVEAAQDAQGNFTGAVEGVPSFGAGKIERVAQWLHSLGLAWDQFGHTAFYSDSRNDIPLLEAVSHPVAANPDAALRALAASRGWPVLTLFAPPAAPAPALNAA